MISRILWKKHYNLGINFIFKRKWDYIVYHNSGSLYSLNPKLWGLLSDSIKKASIKEFKTKINTWIADNCPKLCKKYIGRLKLFHSFYKFTIVSFFCLTICTSYFLAVHNLYQYVFYSNFSKFSVLYIHM